MKSMLHISVFSLLLIRKSLIYSEDGKAKTDKLTYIGYKLVEDKV